MLLDMLSMDMYASYNVKLAQRIGLHTAVYVSELLNINRKAIQKCKMIDGQYFKLDRNYIEQRTTITKKEQKELDAVLVNLNVLRIHTTSKDIISIDLDALTGILLDDNSKIECSIKNIATKKKSAKNEAIVTALKESICVPNVELRKAYDDWIDSVMSRYGWMSKVAIVEGQKQLDSYTGKDLDIALEILRLAAVNGHRDITWSIEKYEENKSNNRISAQLNASAYHTEQKSSTPISFTDEAY